MKTLLIDNYDSYTFNLYQLIAEINGELPIVFRNDQTNWSNLKKLAFDNIIISPGPGHPKNNKDFGVCRQILLKANVPILGVCLGHQGLGLMYGASVIHAPEVMHGRLSAIYHNESALFKEIPQAFSAVRYHSLMVTKNLPAWLEKTAWTQDGIIMGLRHQKRPLWGVQFHPESISSEYGKHLLANFIEITQQFHKTRLAEQPKIKPLRFDDSSLNSTSTVPSNSHQKQPSEYTVLTRKLDIYVNAEQVFVHLYGKEPTAFWLDSSQVESGLCRFSFMGGGNGPNSQLIRYRTFAKELVVTDKHGTKYLKESIFAYLERKLARLYCSSNELPFEFNSGFVGYFGYELKAECEASVVKHLSVIPDAIFLLADQIIAFDHQEKTLWLICFVKRGQTAQAEDWFESIVEQLCTLPPLSPPVLGGRQEPVTFWLSRSYHKYLDNIQECLHEITEGETYEICLTNKIHTNIPIAPLTLYRTLRRTNPAPYSAFLRFNDIAILSSSPEHFLKIDRTRWVETKPIKGTLARGKTAKEDASLYKHLRSDPKSRAENLMIVDLLRNDLGRVCEIGSIHVPKLMDVETYATVHQLVSTIRGRLHPEKSAIDCIRAVFPGGSMTGAPKLRTMEIIDRIEQEARGIYSGSLGFLALNGTIDLNIVIRTAVMTPTEISIGVGGAIIALSDPKMEYEEMLLKAHALIRAILMTVSGKFEPKLYRIMGAYNHTRISEMSFSVSTGLDR